MKGGNYSNQIFRQLQDVIKKCDDLSSEITIIKKEHRNEILETEAKYLTKIDELKEKIDNLETENESIKKENKMLKDENDRLKGILNKDSTNSSIPPSKDDKAKRKKVNLREKTNKKSGGQQGHKGKTLTKRYVEELLEKEDVKKEVICHGNPKNKYCVTKYELDTKTIVVVKEHRFYFEKKQDIKIPKEYISDVHYGENFKTLCNIMIVEEVISLERIKQFVEILTSGLLRISEGSLVNWLEEKSNQCKKVLKEMKIQLKNTKLIHTDLTETNVRGKKGYVRNYSTEKMTVYVPCRNKKIQTIKRQWILNGYTGYIVHDHDTALYNLGIQDKHVECNVHLRRYLKNNTELTKHEWSKEMDKLLLKIKRDKEVRVNKGITKFTAEEIRQYNIEYDEIINLGYKENKASNSKYLKKDEKAILNRLKKYKKNHLSYAYNFEVPFDNNLSERDLRPIKTKKKVSGCHRNYRGLKNYCNIRSIISTCKKQGIDYFKELVNIGKGNPITIL